IADAQSGFSRQLTFTPVLATLVTTFQWSKDGKRIQTVLLPDDGKRDAPKPNGVATEPKVRVAREGLNPSRTYRYLLESPYAVKLLEHLATGQLALIDVFDGKVTKIGCPNLLRSVSMAPGESHFRVTTMKKPFSYFVPMARFGTQEGVWDLEGKCLCTLADRNLRENEPQPPTTIATQPAGPQRGPGQGPARGGRTGRPTGQPAPTTPTPPNPDPDPDPTADPNGRRTPPLDPDGKRDIVWRPDGAGLSFLQLEPAKKDSKEPRKDRVNLWVSPFGKDDVKVVYESPHRISSVQYSEDCRILFLTQTIDNQRQVSAIDLAEPKTVYVIHKSAAARGPSDAPRPGANPAPTTGDGDSADQDDDEQPPAARPGLRGPGGAFGGGAGPSLLTR